MSERPEKPLPRFEERPVEADQRAILSEKRLKANRENAKKSTGPRTPQGKAHSRRNAIKHGLFARPILASLLQGEDTAEYDGLLADLKEQHKPVGRAEELEVERIAQSWWRLKRAHQFENAVRSVAIRDVAQMELSRQCVWSIAVDEKDEDFIQQLEKLSDEIESNGEVPTDLKERLIAIRPEFRPLWPLFEAAIERVLTQPSFLKMAKKCGPGERPVALALATIFTAVEFIRKVGPIRRANITEVAYDQHAIPNSDALDKLLRYEAAIDRNLGRAVDRLERLQRARKGESLLQPASVRFTR